MIKVSSAGTAGQEIVTVLPMTHESPSRGATAIEVPPVTKERLGLDSERSWVVLTEANRFLWPGPDLRPARAGDIGTVAYGLLPYDFTEEIRAKFAELVRSRMASIVSRTE